MTDVIFLPFLTSSKSIDYKHLIFYLSSPPFSLVAGFNIIASGGESRALRYWGLGGAAVRRVFMALVDNVRIFRSYYFEAVPCGRLSPLP